MEGSNIVKSSVSWLPTVMAKQLTTTSQHKASDTEQRNTHGTRQMPGNASGVNPECLSSNGPILERFLRFLLRAFLVDRNPPEECSFLHVTAGGVPNSPISAEAAIQKWKAADRVEDSRPTPCLKSWPERWLRWCNLARGSGARPFGLQCPRSVATGLQGRISGGRSSRHKAVNSPRRRGVAPIGQPMEPARSPGSASWTYLGLTLFRHWALTYHDSVTNSRPFVGANVTGERLRPSLSFHFPGSVYGRRGMSPWPRTRWSRRRIPHSFVRRSPAVFVRYFVVFCIARECMNRLAINHYCTGLTVLSWKRQPRTFYLDGNPSLLPRTEESYAWASSSHTTCRPASTVLHCFLTKTRRPPW